MVSRAEFTLGQLAEALGATLEGDPARVVRGVAPLESAGPDDVSFLTDARYRAAAQASRAGAFVAGAGVTGLPASILTVAAPQQAMIDLLLLFHPAPPLLPGAHPSAAVAAAARATARFRRRAASSSRTTWRSAPTPRSTARPSAIPSSAGGPRSTISSRSGTTWRWVSTRSSWPRSASRGPRSLGAAWCWRGRGGAPAPSGVGKGPRSPRRAARRPTPPPAGATPAHPRG